jgi:hypothetical protein
MGMSKPMVFDGVDDTVVLPDNSSLDVTADSDFSIFCWVNAIAGSCEVFYKRLGGGDGYGMQINSSGFINPMVDDGTAEISSAVSDTDIRNAGWTHIGITFDRSGNATGYINGAADGTTDISSANGDLSNAIDVTLGNTAFQGIINETSLWSAALSLAQVQELFNDGVALDATAHSQSSNLTGYWRNDGASSWEDRSTNSNTGTPAGSPDTILLPQGTTAGKDILGFPLTHTNNGWLNLDGNEYVDAGDSRVLDIRSSITLECWIKPSKLGVNHFIITRDDGSSDRQYKLYVWTNNQVYFDIYLDGGNKKETLSSTAVTLDTWSHVVATYDGSNQKVYFNGALEDDDAETGLIDNDDTSFTIGAQEDGVNAFTGSIDEVKVYNRALTLAEVTKNYKHGLSKHS